MRLLSIQTEKLFGIFDHIVKLNVDERITIIHGPNGFGKTAILRLIADIFSSRHTAVRELPFASVKLRFDDGNELVVSKDSARSHGMEGKIEFRYGKFPPYELSKTAVSEDQLDAIERHIGRLNRVGPEEWIFDQTGEILGIDELLERFGGRLPIEVKDKEQPAWLNNLRDSLDVHFIRATRLESSRVVARDSRKRRRKYTGSVVNNYAEELADLIRRKLAEYAELSQSLDRSFPRRLVNTSTNGLLPMQEIRDRLALLELKRTHLTGAGLLDKEQESSFDATSLDDTKAEVLSLYIEDVEKKLAVFDSLYERINLLKSILNKRFSFKSVSIDKNDGIEFRTQDDALLDPSYLSSGEQHEVVLLYQLLFKVERDSLILIDEPELSLHIAWQEEFLKDLERVASVSSFDVVIATHSPQIIGERWDLTVELKGPNTIRSAEK